MTGIEIAGTIGIVALVGVFVAFMKVVAAQEQRYEQERMRREERLSKM
tara:strand:+ start:2329 stop:2472 length:144 start_codon:yes stop_codon:yes gene_type:complete